MKKHFKSMKPNSCDLLIRVKNEEVIGELIRERGASCLDFR